MITTYKIQNDSGSPLLFGTITIPTGTTEAGSIWFTSSSMYVGLE